MREWGRVESSGVKWSQVESSGVKWSRIRHTSTEFLRHNLECRGRDVVRRAHGRVRGRDDGHAMRAVGRV